jgi:hypothetical protein
LITPFGCGPRSVETARALRPLLRAADFFAARLDRFLAMAISPLLIADMTRRRGEPAVVAARHYPVFTGDPEVR